MSCNCSPFASAANQYFTTKRVAKELRRYRRRGPGRTTAMLRDALTAQGQVGGTLLDVGAGFGPLTFELLERGITRATAIDASAAYVDAGRSEAIRRGKTDAVEFVHGDFVEVARQLPRASVVALDRVVCCYPAWQPLVADALTLADNCVALSYPRDRWYVRAAIDAENRLRWARGNAFRAFVHPVADLVRAIRHAGFGLVARQETWMWSVDVWTR